MGVRDRALSFNCVQTASRDQKYPSANSLLASGAEVQRGAGVSFFLHGEPPV